MSRLTQKAEDGGYRLGATHVTADETEAIQAAVNKLAQFENLHEDLLRSQQEITVELETLRQAGKKNSVRFRELMSKKLMNAHMLDLFQLYAIQN